MTSTQTDNSRKLSSATSSMDFAFALTLGFFVLVGLLWTYLSMSACTALWMAAKRNEFFLFAVILYFAWPIIFGPIMAFKNFFLWRSAAVRSGAYFIDPQCVMSADEGFLLETVHRQAKTLGLPCLPAVGIIPDEMNAFAVGTGRGDSGIFFGKPLLQSLSEAEIAAVSAHELAHVANRDTVAKTMLLSGKLAFQDLLIRPMRRIWLIIMGAWLGTAGVAGNRTPIIQFIFVLGILVIGGILWAVLSIADWMVTLVFNIIEAAFARRQEFIADAIGARLEGPDAMISALSQLHGFPALRPAGQNDPLAASKIFRWAAPSDAYYLWGIWPSLFATHPDVTMRIKTIQRTAHPEVATSP